VLPFPVAVLDAEYRFLLLNRASAADALLARGRVGETDLACCDGEPAALERACERHRQYERSLLTQEPLSFEEDAATDAQRRLWLCVPVRIAGNPRLIVVGIGNDFAGVDQVKSMALLQHVHTINQELRAPLAALVGLAGTLALELSGEQQARALLIDQSGQRLLKQLSVLMKEARS
jgi:signal transduction histidine kinase